VGAYANGGCELRAQGDPEDVYVHDFVSADAKVASYGLYDLHQNEAWVSVGVVTTRRSLPCSRSGAWWKEMGAPTYHAAGSLVITADGGGSNGYQLRLWKLELQGLVGELGFPITVCHLPPGTSKWNKIEHRLFSFITQNWRGKPLITHQVIVNLIAATTTSAGLTVRSRLDDRLYEKERHVSDQQLACVTLSSHAFHGEWNYTIHPTTMASLIDRLILRRALSLGDGDMSLLMQIPISDGMVICSDKRGGGPVGGYQDDAVKLAQIDNAWLLVFIGTVGFGGRGRVPIEGFMAGSRPDADCAIAELAARFVRGNRPPREGVPTPLPRSRFTYYLEPRDAEHFLPGGRGGKMLNGDTAFIAAPVGKKWIGLNRCPDVAMGFEWCVGQ
jgi:hypothetical protein